LASGALTSSSPDLREDTLAERDAAAREGVPGEASETDAASIRMNRFQSGIISIKKR
jgi:hypothetical protein